MRISNPITLFTKDLSFYHSLLKSCLHGDNSSSPITIFRDLLRSSLRPNHFTMSILLQASSTPVGSLNLVQTHLKKSGIDRFVYVKTSLLDLYLKMGFVATAGKLFDEMPERDTVAWNAMICGYSRNGCERDAWHLFIVMLRQGFLPSATTLANLLPFCGQCGFVSQGRSVHCIAAKSGLELDSQVKNALISFYSKCTELDSAEVLFTEMKDKSTVSWNTMIGAYSQSGLQEKAITVFKDMFERSVEISPVTVINLLSAHVSHEPLHSLVVKTGMVNDNSVITSLVCAYSRCGCLDSAERLYASSAQDSIVGLTSIVSSYAEEGDMDIAVAYFSKMRHLCMRIDAVALVGILHGCTNSSHIEIGTSLHGYAIQSGLCTQTLVVNGLITMYSKFDDIETVLFLFETLHETPLISWNSVISGCVQSGRASTAFEIFHQMSLSDGHVLPDAITIASLLAGCSQLSCLHLGKTLHGYILRNSFGNEKFVCTALIDMYAKCGNAELSERVFKTIEAPCTATWNSMISGYSLSGLQSRALSCYSEMREQGMRPDKITFLGVLSACTHGGLVDEGRVYFREMIKEFGMSPSLQHYALMVGLLGRGCLFSEALSLIWEMDMKADSAVWGALLSACIVNREIGIGEYVAKKMFMLDYRNGGLYVLMSNLYATEGMWDDVSRVRRMMKDNGYDGYLGVSQTL
ncbi:pentatricopeptide repeat-containing protein At2g04860-like [Brassica napus]|uniref:(rape) hypothetical protein n=1 Tax=Brassica napus TaxID=3708 RepID=A0A816VWS2_BRANA|nr:pentatricopeptide repeat-containing protein At2g04860-like [Brassica napus]CAF2128831.1 unnamed protein product [Brassica napus]